ncbi:MAG: cell division protein FtsZ [Candidatus Paceibacterota bacterium]|jgi:cell division protein FtsZ|nr:cell division protein FtsZ [Candidatus Paceibacterota bacterium]MDD3548753.1 cell division protein FtsZ [Candidatus Paceibacterota bacterium]MDD4998955.1 cell division protein FtsZ [Candidatus Paceibacterota bacterium]MDD5545411.1 cell division protein FtsZ [Candidatus Paceibacterota bacterium]
MKKDKKIEKFLHNSVKIKIVGVGGAGGNVVSRIREKKLETLEYVVINTDLQGLNHSKADTKIQIGKNACRGLGAGMDPDKGREAAEENIEEINQVVQGADLIFLACGLGGGTGSGASPIVASLAKQSGALVIGVVTKPFSFEGEKRMEIAEDAWQKIYNEVDALVTIANDRIFNLVDEKTPILEAFGKIDSVLKQGVEGIVNLIACPGLINLDFANIKTTLSNTGSALLGIGKSQGEERAKKAAQMAISSPLLDISIEGAKRILFNIAGGSDMSLVEIHDAARVITQYIAKDSKVIFGTSFDEDLKKGEMKVTVIAGGFGDELKTIGSTLPLGIKIPVNEETKEEKEKEAEEKKEELMPSFEDKELEIPAFLRRKKKKY